LFNDFTPHSHLGCVSGNQTIYRKWQLLQLTWLWGVLILNFRIKGHIAKLKLKLKKPYHAFFFKELTLTGPGASPLTAADILYFYAQNAIFFHFFLRSRFILSLVLIEIWHKKKHVKMTFYFNRQHFQWLSTPVDEVHAPWGQILDPPLAYLIHMYFYRPYRGQDCIHVLRLPKQWLYFILDTRILLHLRHLCVKPMKLNVNLERFPSKNICIHNKCHGVTLK